MRIGIGLRAFVSFACVIFVAIKQGLPQEQQPRWLPTATVTGDHVYLADLLAPNTDTQLRDAASRIDLGRAPEPGSFRVFTEGQLQEAVGSLSFDLPAQVTVRRRGYPVVAEQLAAALVTAKLPPVSGTLLSEPQTRTAHAALRVTGIFPGRSSKRALIRFACREPSDCGAFWGEIEVSKDWQQVLSTRNLAVQLPKRITALVVPGRLATLICDEPGMEMRLRVRPLRRAGMGERVRVYETDSRRTFLARVQAEDLVTSDLREAK